MKNIPVRNLSTAKKEPDLSESFSIRDVREMLGGKDMIQELHRHDFFFILALRKGKGNHEIDFNSHEVRNDTVFFMRPGQVHQLHLKAGSTGYLIQFGKDFYYPNEKTSGVLLHKTTTKNSCQLDFIRAKNLMLTLTNIFREYSDKQEGYQEVVKANLHIFFIELIRHRQNKKSNSLNSSLYYQERIEAFLQLLETHIATHKQVSAYADLLNLSTYQLNAIAKTALGKNCSDLINEFIILEAKRFLLGTSNRVNQIAFHLGYDDVSYFIRFFKKHTGYSPEAFRLNFR